MLKGYFIRESDSGLARGISPNPNGVPCVWVPIDRTTRFKRKTKPEEGSRYCSCIFDVQGWLAAKPEYQNFSETDER